VASGYDLGNIRRVFSGEDIGTLFPASPRPNKRQRWMRFATTADGAIVVSEDCKHRILQSAQGAAANVLIKDVRRVEGAFVNRAVVSICDEDGTEVGRGMVQRSSKELADLVVPGGSPAPSFGETQAIMNAHDYVILEA
jgi:glutamate 5-kinase